MAGATVLAVTVMMMTTGAALAKLAACSERLGLCEDRILADLADKHVTAHVATATAMTARRQSVVGIAMSAEAVYRRARAVIRSARAVALALCREGFIPAPPP